MCPAGRKAYESIIKGEPIRKLNIPESFNVLLRELNGLCLNIELVKDGKVAVAAKKEPALAEVAAESPAPDKKKTAAEE